jgi:superfamily II DNA or RNA helicase
LGRFYNDLIIASTTQKLIDEKRLSDFRAFAAAHPDLSGVRIKAGDYHEGDLSTAMRRGALTADIVDTWIKLADHRPTFVFCVDRAHARHLQEQFLARGVRSGYIDANTPRLDKVDKETGETIEGRATVREKFHNREYEVICNVGVLTTGIDWDVRCLVLARPTKSEILFVQIIGRGLRTATGKDYCLILDHSDNHLRLGFVTDIQHEELNQGKKEKNETEKAVALPKECPQCHFLKPAKVSKCPNCGHIAQIKSKTKVEDGELTEIKRKPRDKAADKFSKPTAYGMLKTYAHQRGYQSGWASHKFKEMFGVWPDYYKDAPLCEPDTEMLSWIKSRQIAHAHSKRRWS